ncbi:molybdopterin-dependent oxidoreductase [Microbacterium marinilacus]|uniref:Molybdopterin-dependent oxidoreductase n=1 Tax=Microbacterium marinilacus TaxID=415209 RepID=A0ABP7BIM7_9MICO|nr:molybdopterin-dependent oxidoreductase [Microbacterium marinilacus]MBY0689746.1 molybdopterin-dependent oxidoreductase [Microbacterium marinilacus]
MDDQHGSRTRAAAAGVAAAVSGAGLGELAAALFASASSPFGTIGGALIDLAPPAVKDAAIALFGTADKAALLVLIAVVLLAIAAGAGLLEARRPPLGAVLAAALGGVGLATAVTRADATAMAWLPSAVAGVTAAWVLRALVRIAGRPRGHEPVQGGIDRRRFLVWAGGATALGLLAAAGAQLSRAGAAAVTVVRDALRLPAPASAAPAIPAGAALDVPGIAPLITPNDEFYRIDTALVVPQVDPADWSLRIHGLVEREVTLTWDELLALPLEESRTTLACVSNEVGGDLIGTALWLGYPTRELLARAAPAADADMVLSRSTDGFTASTPLEALTDGRDALLAVGMNGEPLPPEHGFPVRMVVPGLYGYVSATKWVVELEVTRFDAQTAYWTTRGWSERGPIKLQSRIDVPRRGDRVEAGDAVVAGVAWQQHVGVDGVEVQIDDGAWRSADLAPAISDDTWVQWSLPWTAEPGQHVIRCRAIGADGETQTPDQAPPAPDGATGWHERTVTVG